MTAGVLAVAAAAATLAACGSSGPSSPTAPPASALPTAPKSPNPGPSSTGAGQPANSTRRRGARAQRRPGAATSAPKARAHAPAEPEPKFLHAFAAAYARYLSGGPVPPGLSAEARQSLGRPLPSGRAVQLRAVHLHPAHKGVLVLAVASRTFSVPVTVNVRADQWSVATIAPPDLDQLVAPPPVSPTPPPAAAREPEKVARRFLTGYLRLLNGRGTAAQLQDLTPRLRAELDARPVAVPNDGVLRVAHLGITGAGATWTAEPLITNGQTTFELMLTIEKGTTRTCPTHHCHHRRQWVVSAIRSPR